MPPSSLMGFGELSLSSCQFTSIYLDNLHCHPGSLLPSHLWVWTVRTPPFTKVPLPVSVLGVLAELLGMWDLGFLTRHGTHAPLQWKHQDLTTGPPGKSPLLSLWAVTISQPLSLCFLPSRHSPQGPARQDVHCSPTAHCCPGRKTMFYSVTVKIRQIPFSSITC